MVGQPVPLFSRFWALLFYCGLAPIVGWWPISDDRPFLKHHRNHALAAFALLLGVLGLLLFSIALLSYTMIWHRSWYESLALEPRLLDLSWKAFLAWSVVWAFAALHPLFGSTRPVPVINSLAGRSWLTNGTAVLCVMLLLLGAMLTAVSARGAFLLRHDETPGKVYMVYEDLGRVPHFVFSLGFYRLAKVSADVYGPGQAVDLKLTKASLRRALREAEFLFVGSHGKATGLIASPGWFRPEDVTPGMVNPNLKYVYLTGCDSGAQADVWRKALAPAEVVTHNRLTTVLEHVWWLWVVGPNELARKEHRQ